jgi:hypothetical protein
MRRRVVEAAAVAVTATVTVAGCSHTVSGTAQRAESGGAGTDRGYGYVDDRCGLLTDSSVQELLKADNIVRPYSGAVCQYVLSRKSGPSASPVMVDVVFSWFESGSLERERTVAQERKAQITDTVVERHQAFLARRDITGAACAATAAAGSGVLSWWVQYRGQNSGDPCKDAQMLLSKTLQAEL